MLTRLLATSCSIALGASCFGQTYHITDLGPLNTSGTSVGRGVNNGGQVIGKSTNLAGDFAATMWLPAPAYGRPAGANEIAELNDGVPYGMNDLGQLTGFVWGATTIYTPYFWDPLSGYVDLGALGATNGIGRRLNNDGWVVGEMDSDDPDVLKAAFLYDGTQIIELESLGGFQSRATDINESGAIVGYSTYPNPAEPDNGQLVATLWLPEPAYGLSAGLHDLDTLSPNFAQHEFSTGRGLNDLGQVVMWGNSFLWTGRLSAGLWLWLPEADYGLPAGLTNLWGVNGTRATSYAMDVNNRGEVILRANYDPNSLLGDWRATLWRQGEWIDLNQRIPFEDRLVWWLDSALGINDAGQITGQGYKNGVEHGFLLTPIIENDSAPCTADISGIGAGVPDGTVDVLDYLLMIAQWGSPCTGACEADITGPAGTADGNVDSLDFLDLIGQWGACPLISSGSCCFDLTGDCQDLSSGDCAFMGGTFTPGGDCATTTCSTPVGACCLYPADECTMLTEWACGLVERAVWLGPDSDCATAVCPVPATGERIEDPFIIDALPYATEGDTSTAEHDYDAQCTYHAGAPDLVYAYTPTADQAISISLCRGSAYATKLYVFEDVEGNVVACNEDSCSTPNYPDPFVSAIDVLDVTAGHTYYIIVDGKLLEAGFFTLDVNLVEP